MRKLVALASSFALAFLFAVTVQASVTITCGDDPPYAVYYTDGSGGGSRLVQCSGDTFSSLSGTFNDKLSSVVVYLSPGSQVPCAFRDSFYGGNWAKFTAGQHGFTLFQWPYQGWSSGGYMDDQISSIKWCNP